MSEMFALCDVYNALYLRMQSDVVEYGQYLTPQSIEINAKYLRIIQWSLTKDVKNTGQTQKIQLSPQIFIEISGTAIQK